MAVRQPRDSAASVRARLLNLARARQEEFQLLLSDYAIERLLYRLGTSRHADRFVLKGAMLFHVWATERYRATWDIDLLGSGDPSVAAVVAAVHHICSLESDDGLGFERSSIVGSEIRAEQEYVGVRVTLRATLANARIPMQIDVGFGDAVVPAPRRGQYPTLLDHPAPNILIYPREAVVAEKLEAIVTHGATNSRMKDFYDLHVLATHFSFDGVSLTRAIAATFERRQTPMPPAECPELSREFLMAPERRTLWTAFARRTRLGAASASIETVADTLGAFLAPLLGATAQSATFDATWPPGGPWTLRA